MRTTLEPDYSHPKMDVQKINIKVSKPAPDVAAKDVASNESSSQAATTTATGITNAATATNGIQSIPQNTRYQRQQTSSVSSSSTSSSIGADGISNLINIMEKQNVITETLVKQQKLFITTARYSHF